MSLVFGVYLILILLIMFAVAHVMNNDKNELEWSELISTKGQDGKLHPDWNKIGQGCGVFLCLWLPGVYAYSDKIDPIGLATLMGAALLYLGSVSGYASTLRARRGTIETIDETPAPSSSKKTTTETPTP
jgi:hypothetical protein